MTTPSSSVPKEYLGILDRIQEVNTELVELYRTAKTDFEASKRIPAMVSLVTDYHVEACKIYAAWVESMSEQKYAAYLTFESDRNVPCPILIRSFSNIDMLVSITGRTQYVVRYMATMDTAWSIAHKIGQRITDNNIVMGTYRVLSVFPSNLSE